MTQEVLLGLDVGTSFIKAVAVSPDGVERSQGRAPTPWRNLETGAGMDPHELVDAAVGAARVALERAGGRAVAVGVTSMAETGALLDAGGAPVAPMIPWHDPRGDTEAAEITESFGRDPFTEHTGLPPSGLCTLSKYRWMRRHISDAARGVRWLNVAEWMVRSLGGSETAELSLSSRTGMLDLGTRGWWADVLEWAQVEPGFLPEPAPAGTPAGRVAKMLPEAEGAVLTVAGHDHLCASVGAGATLAGDVFDSCGTAEAFVRPVESPLPPKAILQAVSGGVTVGWHVIPGRQALLGGFACGLALDRFLQLLGVDEQGRAELDAAALRVPSGAQGMTVRDVTDPRPTLEAIPPSATPGHVWRAALEAVARRGAEVLATIETVAGETHRLVVTGGWARDPAFNVVKREFLRRFEEPDVHEAGARGAAMIAGITAGLYRGISDLPPVGRRGPVGAG